MEPIKDRADTIAAGKEPYPHHETMVLLSSAAKAAGILSELKDFMGDLWWINDDACVWNPLTQDDDAMRLAIELGFEIYPPGRDTKGNSVLIRDPITGECQIEEVPSGLYLNYTVRLAIVKLAARIGKEMIRKEKEDGRT